MNVYFRSVVEISSTAFWSTMLMNDILSFEQLQSFGVCLKKADKICPTFLFQHLIPYKIIFYDKYARIESYFPDFQIS